MYRDDGTERTVVGVNSHHTVSVNGHTRLDANAANDVGRWIADAIAGREVESGQPACLLDDFLISPLRDTERRDLLEILEDRYGRSSTVITSQLPTKNWHESLSDPTLADAICDRLVHNAHVLSLRGPSIRKKKGMNEEMEKTENKN